MTTVSTLAFVFDSKAIGTLRCRCFQELMSIFKQYGVDAHADLPYGLGWNAFTDFTHDCQVRPTHGEWWLCAPPAVVEVLTQALSPTYRFRTRGVSSRTPTRSSSVRHGTVAGATQESHTLHSYDDALHSVDKQAAM